MSKGENLYLGSTSDILLQLVGEMINVCLCLLLSFVAKSPKPKSNLTLRSPCLFIYIHLALPWSSKQEGISKETEGLTPITAAGCHSINEDGVLIFSLKVKEIKPNRYIHLSLRISPSVYSGQRESQAKLIEITIANIPNTFRNGGL